VVCLFLLLASLFFSQFALENLKKSEYIKGLEGLEGANGKKEEDH